MGHQGKYRTILFNRNMGCIEIPKLSPDTTGKTSLIETWDVLKLANNKDLRPAYERLIETWDVLKLEYICRMSRKMYCLIETWDVLKFNFVNSPISGRKSLIETWDVLKLFIGG